MSSWTQARLSMSTGTQAMKRSMPNKWTQSYQLSMLAWTQAQLSMSKQTQALSHQCQTNGHDIRSYVSL